MIPGISRSGATIATGLLIGNRKEEIAKFSFLMVLVPVIGANLLEAVTSDPSGAKPTAAVLIVGFLSAFTTGYFACKWMINLVKRSKLIWFALYCMLAGTLAILLG